MKKRPKRLGLRFLLDEIRKKEKETGKKFWGRVWEILNKPRRSRVKVNIFKINKFSKKNKGKTLVVPGKVLSYGSLDNKVDVVAFEFSNKAREEINRKGGRAIMLREFIKKKTDEKSLFILT